MEAKKKKSGHLPGKSSGVRRLPRTPQPRPSTSSQQSSARKAALRSQSISGGEIGWIKPKALNLQKRPSSLSSSSSTPSITRLPSSSLTSSRTLPSAHRARQSQLEKLRQQTPPQQQEEHGQEQPALDAVLATKHMSDEVRAPLVAAGSERRSQRKTKTLKKKEKPLLSLMPNTSDDPVTRSKRSHSINPRTSVIISTGNGDYTDASMDVLSQSLPLNLQGSCDRPAAPYKGTNMDSTHSLMSDGTGEGEESGLAANIYQDSLGDAISHDVPWYERLSVRKESKEKVLAKQQLIKAKANRPKMSKRSREILERAVTHASLHQVTDAPEAENGACHVHHGDDAGESGEKDRFIPRISDASRRIVEKLDRAALRKRRERVKERVIAEMLSEERFAPKINPTSRSLVSTSFEERQQSHMKRRERFLAVGTGGVLSSRDAAEVALQRANQTVSYRSSMTSPKRVSTIATQHATEGRGPLQRAAPDHDASLKKTSSKSSYLLSAAKNRKGPVTRARSSSVGGSIAGNTMTSTFQSLAARTKEMQEAQEALEKAKISAGKNRVFTIYGRYHDIREALEARGWVQKFPPREGTLLMTDDVCGTKIRTEAEILKKLEKAEKEKQKETAEGQKAAAEVTQATNNNHREEAQSEHGDTGNPSSNHSSDNDSDDNYDVDGNIGDDGDDDQTSAQPSGFNEPSSAEELLVARFLGPLSTNLIWTCHKRDIDFRTIKPTQWANHFKNNGSMTTKAGLAEALKLSKWQAFEDENDFYPRCFYISNEDECVEFIKCFRVNASVAVLSQRSRWQPPQHILALATAICANWIRQRFELNVKSGLKDIHYEIIHQFVYLKLGCDEAIDDELVTAPEENASLSESDDDGLGNDGSIAEGRPLQSKFKKASAAREKLQRLVWRFTDEDLMATARQAIKKPALVPPYGFESHDAGLDAQDTEPSVVFVKKAAKKSASSTGQKQPDEKGRKGKSMAMDEKGQDACKQVTTPASLFGDAECLASSASLGALADAENNYSATESDWSNADTVLALMHEHFAQIDVSGHRNAWVVKPAAKSRGRGIFVENRLDLILKVIVEGPVNETWVAQKYIETPLLVNDTKFDIRQWVVVTSWNPLRIWMYRDSYLRFSSVAFTLDNLHSTESSKVHLCNNSIQKENITGPSSSFAEGCMWNSQTFEAYLQENGHGDVWKESLYPQMRRIIISSLRSAEFLAEHRKNTFELFGIDFMIDDCFKVWLIEVNSSPDISHSTAVTSELVSSMCVDLLKVVLDKKKNRDTGRFEKIYQGPVVEAPLVVVGRDLAVEGHEIRKRRVTNKKHFSRRGKGTAKTKGPSQTVSCDGVIVRDEETIDGAGTNDGVRSESDEEDPVDERWEGASSRSAGRYVGHKSIRTVTLQIGTT